MNNISRFRYECLVQRCKQLLYVDKNGVPSWSDRDSPGSVSIGKELVQRMPEAPVALRLPPQEIVKGFVETTFSALRHARLGTWRVETGGRISRYYQMDYSQRQSAKHAYRGTERLA
jgi:hypothetical protein